MREKMTEKELEQMRSLQAKAKRVARHEADFWEEVEEREQEVRDKLNIANLSDTNKSDVSDKENELATLKEELASLTEELEKANRVKEAFEKVAEQYGTDLNNLYKYISTDRQISYYRSQHQ